MSKNHTPKNAPNGRPVGRLTGFVLAFVVCICLVMIGIAGFIKYRLDQAQTVLATPEILNSDQQFYNRLRQSLGYNGFLGSAQNLVATHDAAAIPEMKAQIKTATDIVANLPDKVPTETRRDLQAIVSVFNTAEQKIEKNANEPLNVFTSLDLAPLYAALPLLDARITSAAASNRLAAQNQVHFWGMLLTLVAWCSLIIAAAMSVGIYLSLRDRNSAPMRALAQSIRNMSHGDLRSSIWGMERSDMVGELARAVDQARYHFSQLPDMTLISDKGPVRLRFEGNTKSMFEAMMSVIARDSEQVRAQATNLTEAVTKQQQAIESISTQVETVLKDVLQRGQSGELQVKQALNEMLSSAGALKHAHEHATDQLSRLVPYLQERAQGLSEITHLTGAQVAQVLKGLLLTERNLRASAENSEAAIGKLSTTADDLGNRLFGAVNLLQASGKVLAETTESTKSRLDQAIEQLTTMQPSSASVSAVSGNEGFATNEGIARLETLIAALEVAHSKLEEVIGEQTEAAKNQIDFLSSHGANLLTQSATTAQTLSNAADHLREEHQKLKSSVDAAAARLEQSSAIVQGISGVASNEQTYLLLNGISAQVGELAAKIETLQQQQAGSPTMTSGAVPEMGAPDSDRLLIEIRTGFETTVRSLGDMREQMASLVINNQTAGSPAGEQQWQTLAAQIEATRSGLATIIKQQIESLETRLGSLTAGLAVKGEVPAPSLPASAQEQMEQQTQILTELVATLGVLDAHMQQIKSDMQARG